MKEILILAGILLGLAVLKKAVPWLLANVLGRAIGDHALTQTPDSIRLEKAGPDAWKQPAAVLPLVGPLFQKGFHDSGVFQVPEMPGLLVQLLVKSDESLIAAIYEHPQAGHWLDLACRFQDGTSETWTTAPPTGLVDRPGHPVHHVSGLDTPGLLARARAAMPRRALQAVTPFTAPRLFEAAYAESIAYRKKKGVSAREVATIANAMDKAA